MDYLELEKFLSKIKNAKVENIGKSVLLRNIYSVCFDFGSKHTVIIQGAIHAREYITTDLICEFIKDVSTNYKFYKKIGTPNIIFVPMVNPDGVELCINGLRSIKDKNIREYILKINNNQDLSLYKANINGVDLNTNFDAKWGSGINNILYPSPSNYIGKHPMSEPEVQALSRLTIEKKPSFTVSYHSKGEEIYYNFFNLKENLNRDKKIAKIVAKSLKYKIKNIENCSGGGYKDWCILRFNIPSLTIEVGSDDFPHPIQSDKLNQIYKSNRNLIKLLNKVIKEIEKNERILYGASIKGS